MKCNDAATVARPRAQENSAQTRRVTPESVQVRQPISGTGP